MEIWHLQVKAAEEAYAARLEAERLEREAHLQRKAAAERLRALEDEEQRQADAAALSQEREASAMIPTQPTLGSTPNPLEARMGTNSTQPDAALGNAEGRSATAGVADTAMHGIEHKRKQLRAVELRVCMCTSWLIEATFCHEADSIRVSA